MPGSASLQSIQRAVQILYAVAGMENGYSVQQIAARTGLKPNTAYKFLRTLERENLLVRQTHPLRFVLGPALTELKLLDDQRHLLTLAGKLLIQTQAKLPRATFSLLELQGTTTYQRLSVQANRPGVLIQRRDFVVPLYSKASSLLFLAYSHPDEAQRFYKAAPFEEHGRQFWRSPAQLEAFLERVRKLGYCQPDVPDLEGPHFRVAAPVFSPGQEVIAAFGGFVMTDDPKKCQTLLIRLCRQGAAELTRQMALSTR